MTAYNVQFVYTSTFPGGETVYAAAGTWAIRAGIYPVRVIQLSSSGAQSFNTTSGFSAVNVRVKRFSSSTISGGIPLTPIAGREGSDPASATVRYQPVTYNWNDSTVTPGSAVSVSGSGAELTQLGAEAWTPVVETVFAPGSVLQMSAIPFHYQGTTPFIIGFGITFDEERVSRST